MIPRFFGRRRKAGKDKARRQEARKKSRSLLFQSLEERWLLATFTDAAPSLNLVLGSNQQAAIISTGSTYNLTLNSGTWSGTNDANVTGNGSSTLTVTSSGIGAFTTAISITDTGSSGGDAVAFANSLTSGYANNFVVNLTQSSSTVTFTGTSLFTGNSALTAAAAGNIIVNSNASIITAGGSIRLVSTGSNTSLTDSGNVLSNGGSITLQATGAVAVGTGVTVNSGSGTLTLTADVTASGAGDDGVGTLSIDAGATVTSSNTSASAITLRGADVNIDTSSNPAVVGANRQLATSPSASALGLAEPASLAFDSSGNLYVANTQNSTVTKFLAGSTVASATYSAGLKYPHAVAIDTSGNLYVANYGNSTVVEFPLGSTTASAVYSAGVSSPVALTFDSAGNLYVVSQASNRVSKLCRAAPSLAPRIPQDCSSRMPLPSTPAATSMWPTMATTS